MTRHLDMIDLSHDDPSASSIIINTINITTAATTISSGKSITTLLDFILPVSLYL